MESPREVGVFYQQIVQHISEAIISTQSEGQISVIDVPQHHTSNELVITYEQFFSNVKSNAFGSVAELVAACKGLREASLVARSEPALQHANALLLKVLSILQEDHAMILARVQEKNVEFVTRSQSSFKKRKRDTMTPDVERSPTIPLTPATAKPSGPARPSSPSVFAIPQRTSSAGRLNFNGRGSTAPTAEPPGSPTNTSLSSSPKRLDKESAELVERALNKITKSQVEKTNEVLGMGGFATVYKGKYRGCEVAIKSFLPKVGDEEFRKEVRKLSGLRHPNIVQYMGYSPAERWIVMEYMQRGSLFNYIHDARRPRLTWLTKVRMALDAAAAMTYIHLSRVRHCDLNSKNLLLDRDLRIKVADLGLSEEVAEDAFSQTDKRVGTLRWIAPEMLAKNCKSMEKADVYSYGIVLFELGTESIPYSDKLDSDLKRAIQRGIPPTSANTACWRDCPKFKEIMLRCLQTEPERRPSFAKIYDQLLELHDELELDTSR